VLSTDRAILFAQTTHQPTATSAAADPVQVQSRYTQTSAIDPITNSNLGFLTSARGDFIWAQDLIKNKNKPGSFKNDPIIYNGLLYIVFRLSETLCRFDEFQSFASLRHTIRHDPGQFTLKKLEEIIKDLERNNFIKVIDLLTENPNLAAKFKAPLFEKQSHFSKENLVQIIKQHLSLFVDYNKWCSNNFQQLEHYGELKVAICGSILFIADAVNTLNKKYNTHITGLEPLVLASNKLAHPEPESEVLLFGQKDALETTQILTLLNQQLAFLSALPQV
jgi:hypothetical protein